MFGNRTRVPLLLLANLASKPEPTAVEAPRPPPPAPAESHAPGTEPAFRATNGPTEFTPAQHDAMDEWEIGVIIAGVAMATSMLLLVGLCVLCLVRARRHPIRGRRRAAAFGAAGGRPDPAVVAAGPGPRAEKDEARMKEAVGRIAAVKLVLDPAPHGEAADVGASAGFRAVHMSDSIARGETEGPAGPGAPVLQAQVGRDDREVPPQLQVALAWRDFSADSEAFHASFHPAPSQPAPEEDLVHRVPVQIVL